MQRQYGYPKGFLGRIALRKMNNKHLDIWEWGRSHMEINPEDNILDIGCGGGENIFYFLSKVKTGKVVGVDRSETSCKKAIKLNKKDIQFKRSIILCMDVCDINYPKPNFAYITAFCTLKFWDNLKASFEKILFLLKDGGEFIICDHGSYDVDSVIILLKEVGFSQVRQDINDVGYSCIIAHKR